MSDHGRSRSHVVARVDALDAAVKAGFKSRSAFVRSVHRWPGAPSRAMILNLWAGRVIGIDFAEVIALALGKHVGELFELSNGRQIR